MRTVKKWLVPPEDLFDLAMPSGAVLLDAQPQGADNVALWALVDTAAPMLPRRFLLTATGHEIATTAELVHVASFQSKGRPVLEFHLFEAKGAVVGLVKGGPRLDGKPR